MKKRLQILPGGDAQEIAELAIVLPILFAVIFAVFSFGRAYNIYSTITRAAQDGARVASVPLCSTCGSNSCTFNGSTVTTAFPCDTTVTTAVNSALSASKLDPSRITYVTPASTTGCPTGTSSTCTQPSLGSGGTISVCRNVALNTNTNTNSNNSYQACGTIVSFHYSFEFLDVPLLHVNSIQIPASAQVRMEF